LRNGEHSTIDVRDTEIHLARFIFKDAQASDFVGKIVGVGLGVVVCNSQQD
jgi:hypothetical protein